MASIPLLSFRPSVVQACATPGQGRKSPSRTSGNWWTPIFGWSPEPDYIDGGSEGSRSAGQDTAATADRDRDVPESGRRGGGNGRFAAFTEEKARQLRMRTVESSSFHDVMYHSAIASRLASDFNRQSSGGA